MVGYIVTEKPELKMKEYELYGAYYCGLCRAAGRRYGHLCRFFLSYDFVFLAVLLDSVTEQLPSIKPLRCLVHPFRKKSIIEDNHSLDYAADVMVLLAYYKLKDDYLDDKNLAAGGLSAAIHPSITALKRKNEALCTFAQDCFNDLSRLEQEKCSSLDQAAQPFARLMERIFSDPVLRENNCVSFGDREKELSLIFGRMGFHLGKWIYLMDALDDIEENIEKNTYNPLLLRFNYTSGETADSFRARIRNSMEYNLLFCLSETANAWELANIKKHNGIISNILYMGLLRKTEQLLWKGTENTNEKSL